MRGLSLLTFLLLSVISAFGEGKISGKVADDKTGETIIGAVVVLKGSTNGSTTDIDGNFMIPVTAGTYVVEVKYIGYQTKEISDVVVTDGKETKLVVSLSQAKSTDLGEVVIKSSLKKENISALYVQQKNSAAISDGISADVIKRSPDRTTGEVLKRVSGTTIQDNKFVIVRGLSDRYNTAIVDNAILPSTEPNRKAFSFDIIPANVIDNIVITKAATPDLPGDFAGGVISVHTKDIPDKKFVNITVGGLFNSVTTFQPFKVGYKGPTDFLGFDNGTRQLPSSFPTTNQILTNKLTRDQTIQAEQSLNNNYNIKQRSGLPGATIQASTGRSYDMKGNSSRHMGYVAALTYSHNELILKDVMRHYDNFAYTDNSYRYSTNIGGMFNYGYSSAKTKLVWKTLYNRNFDDNFLFREGNNLSSSKYINYYAFDLTQKSLLKSSLEGTTQVGKAQDKINWVVAYNYINNNQPDQKKSTYFLDSSLGMVADNGTIGKSNNRLYSNLNEYVYIASANYTKGYKAFHNQSTLKIGGLTQYRTRDFNARYIGMVPTTDPNVAGAEAYANSTLPLSQLYSNASIGKGVYDLEDITSGSDKYTASTITGAGYAMSDNRINDRIRLVWGARVEYFNLKLQSSLSGKPLNVDTTWIDLLPSANFTYAIDDRSNFRASYYRTVARPELREVAPFAYYDYELSALVNGNPKLTRSQINNADLRYEIFPKNGEVISGSVFYKHFNNTIENEVYSSGISTFEVKPRNFKSAYNVGIEGDMRKSLAFIAPGTIFEHLNFYVNAAYIKSLVTDTAVGAQDRPLTGQSNYVVNSSIGYSTENGKFNVNVLYNRIGQRLYLVGQGGGSTGYLLGNVYERPRNLLDLQATYVLSQRSELRIAFKDILNATYLFYYDQNGNHKWDNPAYSNTSINSAQDYVLQKYRPGTSAMFTYTYKL